MTVTDEFFTQPLAPPINKLPTDKDKRIEQLAAKIPRKRDEEQEKDAERYRWLKANGLQRAWVSLGTDCNGENFVQFKCEFNVPEPPNLPYEDDEGLEWADKDFDAAIDSAIRTSSKEE